MQEVIGFDIDIGGIYIKTEKSKSPPPPLKNIKQNPLKQKLILCKDHKHMINKTYAKKITIEK